MLRVLASAATRAASLAMVSRIQQQPGGPVFEFIDDLLRLEADLVVTLTAPFDPTGQGNDEDRIRLRNLLSDARTQVQSHLDGRDAKAVLANLDQAAESVEIRGGSYGVVIVATADQGQAHLVPFPIKEGVLVDRTPATRYLIQGMRRSPRSRVLVVSDHSARLFEGIRYDMIEVTDYGFPFASDITPKDNRAIAGKFAQDPGGDPKEAYRKYFRTVDAGLTQASSGDPLPLIIAGVRNSAELFEDVSSNVGSVVGRLDGSYEQANAHDIGEAAWKVLREVLKARRDEVVEDLNNRLHTAKAVAGMDEVWQYAREGRGRLLVVEEDYKHTPSVEVDLRLVRVEDSSVDPSDISVMQDPVDELVEHVVRAGGTVEFLASGALADVGRVGLLLR